MSVAPPTVRLLLQSRSGDAASRNELQETIYRELRALAGAAFRQQDRRHTLQPTALVNEAWMRLVGHDTLAVRDRAHFRAIAAMAMRQILIDHARAKNAAKRGGGAACVAIDAGIEPRAAEGADPLDVLALDEALQRLAEVDARQAKVVEMRVFAGLTVAEAAEALEVSDRTVELDWKMARAWLSREMSR